MVDEKKLKDILMSYFSIGDSYTFNLTRVKEGSELSVDDFCEFEESDVDDIVAYVMKKVNADKLQEMVVTTSNVIDGKEIGKTNNKLISKMREKRIGEVNYSISGLRMEIVAYRNSEDIDVRFDDGTIVPHKKYIWFKRGIVREIPKSGTKRRPKASKANERVGEVNTSKNGVSMKIVAYRTSKDIDVQLEDGRILKNVRYRDFKDGKVFTKKNRLGEIAIAKNGMQMTIIAYRSADDIDVQFSDGTKIFNTLYSSFKSGYIKNPNIRFSSLNLRDSRLGEVAVSKSGETMKIVAYRDCQDIDVEFEDGTIAEHKDYSSFKKGTIRKGK